MGRCYSIRILGDIRRGAEGPLLVFFYIFLLSFLMLNSYGSPIYWLSNGTRIEYAGEVTYITFYSFERSTVPEQLLRLTDVDIIGGDSSMVSLFFKKGEDCSLSLLVKEVNDSLGLFEVTLSIGPYVSTKSLWINLRTRQVNSSDGMLLGQTTIWIQPCGVGDRISYIGQGESAVFANLSHKSLPVETPEGPQDALCPILVNTPEYEGINPESKYTPTEVQSIKYFHPRYVCYDADTFILLEGLMFQDALLSAFGIMDFVSILKLVYTNVDLGSPNFMFTVIQLSPCVALVILIALVVARALLVHRRRR